MPEIIDRDWPEDFAHENGNYQNRCIGCNETFIGHKRRFVCRNCATAKSVRELVNAMRARIAVLESAIRTHRDQKADDRCIEDDDRLYEALGDGIQCDRRVGDKAAMLANCARYIERRCEGGGWPTYAELEAQIAELKAKLKSNRS